MEITKLVRQMSLCMKKIFILEDISYLGINDSSVEAILLS